MKVLDNRYLTFDEFIKLLFGGKMLLECSKARVSFSFRVPFTLCPKDTHFPPPQQLLQTFSPYSSLAAESEVSANPQTYIISCRIQTFAQVSPVICCIKIRNS